MTGATVSARALVSANRRIVLTTRGRSLSSPIAESICSYRSAGAETISVPEIVSGTNTGTARPGRACAWAWNNFCSDPAAVATSAPAN